MTCLQEVPLRQQLTVFVCLMDASTCFINQQRICEGHFIRVYLPQGHVGKVGWNDSREGAPWCNISNTMWIKNLMNN